MSQEIFPVKKSSSICLNTFGKKFVVERTGFEVFSTLQRSFLPFTQIGILSSPVYQKR